MKDKILSIGSSCGSVIAVLYILNFAACYMRLGDGKYFSHAFATRLAEILFKFSPLALMVVIAALVIEISVLESKSAIRCFVSLLGFFATAWAVVMFLIVSNLKGLG